MRSGSDRCRSATRPEDWWKPSRTARPDFCSSGLRWTRFWAVSAARSRRSRPRTASTRCAAARWRGRSVGISRPPTTTRSTARRSDLQRAPDQSSLRRGLHLFHMLVKNDAGERVEFANPGLALEHRFGVGIAGVPALHDAGWAEVDILGVGLAFELRRQQPDHMHPRRATVTRKLPHRLAVALGFRKPRGELIDDMAQAMRLLLARDLARDPGGILHVLVPVQHFRHRGRLGSGRIP